MARKTLIAAAPPDDPPLASINALARALGCSRTTLQRLVRRPEWPFGPGPWRATPVRQWLAQRPQHAQTASRERRRAGYNDTAGAAWGSAAAAAVSSQTVSAAEEPSHAPRRRSPGEWDQPQSGPIWPDADAQDTAGIAAGLDAATDAVERAEVLRKMARQLSRLPPSGWTPELCQHLFKALNPLDYARLEKECENIRMLRLRRRILRGQYAKRAQFEQTLVGLAHALRAQLLAFKQKLAVDPLLAGLDEADRTVCAERVDAYAREVLASLANAETLRDVVALADDDAESAAQPASPVRRRRAAGKRKATQPQRKSTMTKARATRASRKTK